MISNACKKRSFFIKFKLYNMRKKENVVSKIYIGLNGIIEIRFKRTCNVHVKATSRRVRVNIGTL